MSRRRQKEEKGGIRIRNVRQVAVSFLPASSRRSFVFTLWERVLYIYLLLGPSLSERRGPPWELLHPQA